MKWGMSGSDRVTLRAPTPSECITLICQILIDRRPCDKIKLCSLSTDSAIILLSLLHLTKSVKELRIEDTQLTIDAIYCVCYLININQIEFLRLINTSLSTSGGLHLLTDAISTNTSLKKIRLMHEELTEDDVMKISQVLRKNKTLEQLYLRYCKITDNGLAQLLSNGLMHNRTLNSLSIRGNELITSTNAVCDIIHNSSLTQLFLPETSLPSDSIPQLLDALSNNNTIEKLIIDGRHREKCMEYKNYRNIRDRLGII